MSEFQQSVPFKGAPFFIRLLPIVHFQDTILGLNWELNMHKASALTPVLSLGPIPLIFLDLENWCGVQVQG